MSSIRIINADVLDGLKQLEDESVHCVVTSPPYYGLRDYGTGDRQIGQEETLAEHIAVLVSVFREVRRVLRKDGTFWLNYGDAYCGGGGFSANAPSSKTSKSGQYGALGAPVSGGIKPNGWNGIKNFRPGSGRADGIVDERGQRNRNGVSAIGFKPKNLLMMPARIAIALQDDGWYLRSEIIWHKINAMPESVTDRPTNTHEKIFLLTKEPRYFYDADAVREIAVERKSKMLTWQERKALGEPMRRGDPSLTEWSGGNFGNGSTRNMRNVWTIPTSPFSEAHFATFPPELVKRCVKAGCPIGGTVLDPFGGSGTTGLVANRLQRDAILIELNPEYAAMAERRIYTEDPMFSSVSIDELPEAPAMKQVTLFDELDYRAE